MIRERMRLVTGDSPGLCRHNPAPNKKPRGTHADHRRPNPHLGDRPAEQPVAPAGDAFHPGGGDRSDGPGRGRCRRDPSPRLGPELDRDGLPGGARIPRPLRDHGVAAARPAVLPIPHRYLAPAARHAWAALHLPARSGSAMAGRWHHRLAVGRGGESGRSHCHPGNGFARRTRPDRRTPSRPAPDDRSSGRPRRADHAERRRGHDPHPGAAGPGEIPQRGGQGDGRAGLFQRRLSVRFHARLSAPDLRRLRAGAHVLGHRHHQNAVLLAAMRDDVHRGTVVAE